MRKAIQRIIDCYEQGIIIERETIYTLFDEVTAEDFADLPTEWREKVIAKADRQPADDDDATWSKMLTIFGGCYPLGTNAPTQEEIRTAQRARTKIVREIIANYKAKYLCDVGKPCGCTPLTGCQGLEDV